MKTHLFSKVLSGLLLSLPLLTTACVETSNNFFVPDHEAPSLLSITPSNGETVDVDNTILLTFNERVKAGDGKVTFNGKEVTLTFKDKTASYTYGNLAYNQNCDFIVSPGAISDLYGNLFDGVSVQFVTSERPQPEARIFDAVVSLAGKGTHTSIQKAIDEVPANRTEPWLIFVMNGIYEEQIIIPENKPFVHLIGQDADKTIIKLRINSAAEADASDPDVWNYSYKKLGKSEAAMVSVKASDFYAENISFINGYGKELQKGPMALAMYTQNDRNSFNNCKFISFQDTWQTNPKSDDNGRVYAQNCWIEGAVDYFYGNGNCLLEHCTFYNMRDGAVIVAPSHNANTRWGYVMSNCIVDGNEQASNGKVKLGRPWHNSPMTVYLNTTFNIDIAPEGWTDMGTIPKLFAEYNSKGKNGEIVDLSQRKTLYSYEDDQKNTVSGSCKAVLTASEAAQYTYENVISEGDYWNPRKYMEKVDIPTNLKKENGVLSWGTSKYAICYLVLNGDEVVQITKETSCNIQEGNTYQVRAVGEYGSLSDISQEI